MHALRYATISAAAFLAISLSVNLTRAYSAGVPDLPDPAVDING